MTCPSTTRSFDMPTIAARTLPWSPVRTPASGPLARMTQAGEDERRHPSAQAQQMQAGAERHSTEEIAALRRRQAARATRDELE